MSSQYSRDHCKIAVVKILQTIGWHTINSTPLEVLTDLLVHYIKQISKVTTDFTTEFGNTEANLDHLGLAFQEMGINLAELNEYVTYVNFCPTAQPVPKFPVHKEDNLNFLKPGSQEVVTRPVHIHEHMPPMYPLLEESDVKPEDTQLIKEEPIDELNATSSSGIPQFKKPADVSPEFRRFKREDEGSRPTREISSVMMTTSGFLSPAREGRLPEAKAPIPPAPVEPPPPPPPAPAPPVPLTSGVPPIDPAVKKKMEKREKKINKELFKPIMEEKIVKKNASVKDVVKMKQKAAAAAAANMATNSPNLVTPNLAHPVPLSFFQSPRLSEIKVSPVLPQKLLRDPPDKALAAAKARTEKFNTTITPIPIKTTSPLSQMTIQQVEKLVNEPDRKKINILRKISNVKDNKVKKEARANTPNLIMDEGTDIVNKISLSSDITIEPIPMRRSPSMFFDDGSPPGTPSTPRTPDIMLHHPSPPLQKEKRKRKDPKPKVKKPRKTQHRPMFTESELMDIIVNRPKTPEPHVNHMRSNQLPAHMGLPSIPFPFLTSFGGPGLIPPQLTTPMFPFSHLGGLPNFGKTPYFASNVPNFSSQMDVTPSLPAKVKEPKEVKEPPPVEVKPPPVEIIPQPPPPIQQQPIQVPETSSSTSIVPPKTPTPPEIIPSKKSKEHKKEKKDKIKKKNKKDKVKEKGEKKKVKEPKKEGKEKVKREKKVKKKDKADKEKEKVVEVLENPVIPKILLKVNSPSPRPETPERKLNIKPIVKKEEDILQEKKREPSPVGLAKISALVTGPPKPKSTSSPVPPPEKQAEEPPPAPAPRTPGRPRLHPLKPKPPPKPKKIEQQAFKRIDEHGNEVWICPKCGQQDDGRPMIGCDGCDAWYHWVCVGIQVPPDENENWYCNPCLVRKNEDFQSDKKRKRKRKEKKEH